MAGVKGKSGRKPKSALNAETQKTLQEAAVDAVKLIRDYVRGKDAHGNKVSITAVKLNAATLCIAHAIGLPRQKVEMHHTGEQLSLKDLAMLAQSSGKTDEKSLQSGESLVQNADKSGEKELQVGEKSVAKPFQNDVGTDSEVINIPTKPLKKTIKTEVN